ELRRLARAARHDPRHRRRQDGRLHPRGQARPAERLPGAPEGAGLLAKALARRDGLPRLARATELLGLRAPLRPAGPHVRAELVVEPTDALVHGLRVVGALPPRREPDGLRERRRAPARAAARAAEPHEP